MTKGTTAAGPEGIDPNALRSIAADMRGAAKRNLEAALRREQEAMMAHLEEALDLIQKEDGTVVAAAADYDTGLYRQEVRV